VGAFDGQLILFNPDHCFPNSKPWPFGNFRQFHYGAYPLRRKRNAGRDGELRGCNALTDVRRYLLNFSEKYQGQNIVIANRIRFVKGLMPP